MYRMDFGTESLLIIQRGIPRLEAVRTAVAKQERAAYDS